MGWTKRQFIEAAYEEIGLGQYIFEMEIDQLFIALKRMDAMVARWSKKNIYIGYAASFSLEESELDKETNVPDFAIDAIFLNLALRLVPTIGKKNGNVSNQTKRAARMAYNELFSYNSVPAELQMPGHMPAGQGNKPWRNLDPFLDQPKKTPNNVKDDILNF